MKRTAANKHLEDLIIAGDDYQSGKKMNSPYFSKILERHDVAGVTILELKRRMVQDGLLTYFGNGVYQRPTKASKLIRTSWRGHTDGQLGIRGYWCE